MRVADPALLRHVVERLSPALRHHDDGQGHDRRGSSAVTRLHRARVPAGATPLAALRRSHRRTRLRYHRGRIRSLDRRHAAPPRRHRNGRRRALGQARPPGDRRSRSIPRAACRDAAPPVLPGRTRRLPSTVARSRQRCGRHRKPFTAHAAIDAVRARAAARRHPRVRCRRAYASDRQPMDRARAEIIPDHQRLVVDGLRTACRDRGQARAARSAGRLR